MKRMWSKNELVKQVKEVKKDISTLVDADGHPRFIEGDISNTLLEGVERLYGKWSLSGSHLLIVDSLSIANTTTLTDGQLLSVINIPEWVFDKITPLVGTVVEYKTSIAYASDYSKQNFTNRLHAQTKKLNIYMDGEITLSKDRVVRIEYDLLINND